MKTSTTFDVIAHIYHQAKADRLLHISQSYSVKWNYKENKNVDIVK